EEQRYVRADLEYEQGKFARDRGDFLVARQHFVTAREEFLDGQQESVLNVDRVWGVLRNLGFVAHQLGDLETAAQMYKQCFNALRDIGSRGYIVILLIQLALVEEQRGNRPAALGYAGEALEWARKLGMAREQAQAEAIVRRLGTAET